MQTLGDANGVVAHGDGLVVSEVEENGQELLAHVHAPKDQIAKSVHPQERARLVLTVAFENEKSIVGDQRGTGQQSREETVALVGLLLEVVEQATESVVVFGEISPSVRIQHIQIAIGVDVLLVQPSEG